eukprot:2070717-Prymnesium_polylepis.1
MPHTMLHPMRPSSMPPCRLLVALARPSGRLLSNCQNVNSIDATHTAPLPERDIHSTGVDAAAMHAG